MNRILLLLFSSLLYLSVQAQQIVSVDFDGSLSKSQIQGLTGLPPDYAADFYRVEYTTLDLDGQLDTASGLMALPVFSGTIPTLCYLHGTTDGKLDVPSEWGTTDFPGAAFAGEGYAYMAPDYLGMGVSKGFHPYVHAASQASASVDMMRALRSWLPGQTDLPQLNDQLFITGYSQGGHASMSVHRAIETELGGEFEATAASHMSGPYSISDVMLKLTIEEEPYLFTAYLAYVLYSYQEAYGDLFDNIEEIVKPPYAALMKDFYDNYDNGASVFDLNDDLNQLLIQNEGQVIPRYMWQDSILPILENQPDNHPLIQALRDNDVYDWAPAAPTRILYCEADDQVPFENAILADSVMVENGAADLTTLNVNANADHGQCAPPAFLSTLLFFNQFADITTSTRELASSPLLKIVPNPASTEVHLQFESLPSSTTLLLFDVSGRQLREQILAAGSTSLRFPVHHLPEGSYYLMLYNESGSFTHPLVVSR